MSKDRTDFEDTSSYGDDTKRHILEDANGAVNPFKPGKMDVGTSGFADNPDHDKTLEGIVEDGKKQ